MPSYPIITFSGDQSKELQYSPSSLYSPDTYSPDRVIVKFKPGKIDRKNGKTRISASANAALNTKVIKDFNEKGIAGYQVVQLPKGLSVQEAIAKYKMNPDIELAEPDFRVTIEATPNDPGYSSLWGLESINASKAWDLTTGSPDVIVAVIDTGVDYNHPDLAANIWINTDEIPNNGIDDDANGYIDDVRGWNFVAKNNNPMDNNGHGTHCAGTISAVGNNSIGVTGVTWNAKIMPLRFLDDVGNGWTSDAVDAVLYANANGASVISNSWGGHPYNSLLHDAIQQSNALVVCSAGNSNKNNDISPNYPANYPCDNIIAVAASDSNNDRAWFSSFGLTTVDMAAPGVNINSTIPGNSYGRMDGTSMATPHVAGIAALIKSENPTLTNIQVKQFIMNNVDPLPVLSGITVTGGKVNAYKAIKAAHPVQPPSITGLSNTTYQPSFITWSWNDPSSADFHHVMVYMDGVFQANVTRGVQTYSASPLAPGTQHTMATHTVGLSGLINQTWVNSTRWTAPDTTLNGSLFVQSNPSGARIYLDYGDTGFVTPKTMTNLLPGTHVIRCSLVGYNDTTQTISIISGQTTTVMMTLQKIATIAPKADFSASARNGGSPLPVQFTDKSTNSPTLWSWTFGDGTTSNEQNPSHTYLKEGSYSVKLKVSNPSGSNGLSRSGYITVSAGPVPTPTPTPTATPTPTPTPTLTPTPTPTPTSSPTPTPTPTPDPTGALKAGFAADPKNGAMPLVVSFQDLSTGTPTSWSWAFGDGTTSNLQNPSHTYVKAGSYPVKLKVSNQKGSNSLSRSDYIVVTGPGGIPTYIQQPDR